MSTFQQAAETIDRALAQGEIGQPVAVRILAQTLTDPQQLEPSLAAALTVAERWLGAAVREEHRFGSGDTRQLTLLSRLAGGQSALISVGQAGERPPLLAIEFWGNHGLLTWEDDGDSAAGPLVGQLSAAEQRRVDQWRSEPPGRGFSPERQHLRASAAEDRAARQNASPPYGVLLIAGDHTHQPGYAADLAADPRCRLIGVVDESDVSAERQQLNARYAARVNLPLLPDLTAALARDDVQIVSLCAEPIRRGRIAVQAAEAGKHLYLDKPLAGTLAEANAIVAAAERAQTVAHMFSLVHSDAANRVRRVVESEVLGELTALHLDLCFAKGPAGSAKLGSVRQESASPERYELADSKRELTNIGVYPLVQLLSLIDAEPVRVAATTGNYFFAEHQANDMEDFGQLAIEFASGLTATISVGRTGWQSCPAGGLQRAYLVGTKGATLVDAHRPRVETWSDGPPWKAPQRNPEDPMGMWAALPDCPYRADPKTVWTLPGNGTPRPDVQHFLDCIEQGRDSVVPARLAAAATEILLAGYRSAASGRAIELPLNG